VVSGFFKKLSVALSILAFAAPPYFLQLLGLLIKKLTGPLYKRYFVIELLLLQMLVCFWFQIFSLANSRSFHLFPHGTFVHYTWVIDHFGFQRKVPLNSIKIRIFDLQKTSPLKVWYGPWTLFVISQIDKLLTTIFAHHYSQYLV